MGDLIKNISDLESGDKVMVAEYGHEMDASQLYDIRHMKVKRQEACDDDGNTVVRCENPTRFTDYLLYQNSSGEIWLTEEYEDGTEDTVFQVGGVHAIHKEIYPREDLQYNNREGDDMTDTRDHEETKMKSRREMITGEKDNEENGQLVALLICAALLIMGSIAIGRYVEKQEWKQKAVERGVAEYDSRTGKWHWIVDKKQNNKEGETQ